MTRSAIDRQEVVKELRGKLYRLFLKVHDYQSITSDAMEFLDTLERLEHAVHDLCRSAVLETKRQVTGLSPVDCLLRNWFDKTLKNMPDSVIERVMKRE